MSSHRWRRALLCAGLLFTVAVVTSGAGIAEAKPRQGFGLYAGGTTHHLSDSDGTTWRTNGFSIGMDYQVPMAESWSVNFLLQSSAEGIDNCPGCAGGHGILGAELRFWLDAIFVGAHLGSYSDVRSGGTFSAGGFSGSGGTGVGAVVGWEGADSGLFLAFQADKVQVSPDSFFPTGASSDITGARLHVGYRWGK